MREALEFHLKSAAATSFRLKAEATRRLSLWR
jgi:hypothetical protein